MKIEIEESKANRLNRLVLKSIFIYMIGFFIVCIPISLLIGVPFITFLSSILFLLGCFLYPKNRIVRITLVEDNLIVVQDGRKQVELKKENILYVVKFVKFTVTKSFLLAIVIKGGRFWTLKRYLVFSSSQSDLIGLFNSIGIRLRNVP